MLKTRFLSMAAVALFVAGCQTEGGPIDGPRITRAPSGVEGDWVGTDGVAMSRFTSGNFETFATDTGSKLAQGSYRFRDSRTIDIQLTSLIRQTTSSVACSLVTSSQLNCTSSGGQQFVLVRRGIS